MPAVQENPRISNVRLGHSLGWSFTPLAGKRPILKAWQSRPHEKLEQALAWAAQGNIGLRTGRISGVVVIDVDEGGSVESLSLLPTAAVRTGGGGTHLYFRFNAPLGNSVSKLGPHIDVKADGGQVVFAGSVHPETTRTYEWIPGLSPREIPLADLPARILDLLRVPGRAPSNCGTPPRELATPGHPSAEVFLNEELAALCRAPEGTRNNTLNKAAFRLGSLVASGHLDRLVVESALLETALAIGLGNAEAKATIQSGLDAGGRRSLLWRADSDRCRQVSPR